MHVQEREIYKWALGLVTATFNFGTLFGTRFTAHVKIGFFPYPSWETRTRWCSIQVFSPKMFKINRFFCKQNKKIGWRLAPCQWWISIIAGKAIGSEHIILDFGHHALRLRGDAKLLKCGQRRSWTNSQEVRDSSKKTGHSTKSECPVCFDNVSSPIKMNCGHLTCSRRYLPARYKFPCGDML